MSLLIINPSEYFFCGKQIMGIMNKAKPIGIVLIVRFIIFRFRFYKIKKND